MQTAKVFFFAALCLVLAGCAARVPADGTQPGRPGTPYEQALVANAILANANEAVADGIIAAHAQGLIGDGAAAAWTAETFRIAAINKQVSEILRRGPEAATRDAAELESLLDDITNRIRALIASGHLGVKNPNTQRSLAEELETVRTLATQTLAWLRAAGVLR